MTQTTPRRPHLQYWSSLLYLRFGGDKRSKSYQEQPRHISPTPAWAGPGLLLTTEKGGPEGFWPMGVKQSMQEGQRMEPLPGTGTELGLEKRPERGLASREEAGLVSARASEESLKGPSSPHYRNILRRISAGLPAWSSPRGWGRNLCEQLLATHTWCHGGADLETFTLQHHGQGH